MESEEFLVSVQMSKLKFKFKFVLVIGMLGVQLHINHESFPKKRKNLSECEARGSNLVFSEMTSD